MGSQYEILINTHFRLLNMGSANGFLRCKLILFAAFFAASVSALFRFLKRAVFRVKGFDDSQTKKLDCSMLNSNCVEEEEAESKKTEFAVTDNKFEREKDASEEEEETPNFVFKFEYQTCGESFEPIISNSAPSTSTSKYEFLSGKGLSHYLVEKPAFVNLTVKEFYSDSVGRIVDCKEKVDNSDGCLSVKDLAEQKGETQASQDDEDVQENKEEVAEKIETEPFIEEFIAAKGKAVEVENNAFIDQEVSRNDVQFLSEKELNASDSDSDSDSITSSHEFMKRFVASISDGFLSEKDFEDASRGIDLGFSSDEELDLEDVNLQNLSAGYEADDFEDEDSDIMEELQGLEESISTNAEDKNSLAKEFENKESLDNSDKSYADNNSAWDSEDSNGLETLWEHQDLIEQLKMELKKVKATGLPTILEEDESPKIMDDLKPWKIDEKFQHEDRMGELHKFYRSYRERMRKFDILNYQKMYALGFIQSKDPLQSISSHKSSAPAALTSLFSQKLLLGKRKKSGCDPMMSFIRELHSDLEMVYVGQMCLSWEILHWQYDKAYQLWESDPYLLRRYNEVAGEFQQFQVLMQRFIENEPFEGPRVQNFVKKRCVLRNLLQVPVIREDSVKDKKARRKGKDDYAITSDKLVEIMEESIRIFWRFVKADKDAHSVVQKGRKGTQVEPQDPSELELFTEVRTNVLQKDKKLKEILRSGNCILRKFQKCQEDGNSDQVLYFFSQVDIKLVSRVLNMSKITTDQLLWCHNKLSRINFVSRKLHVEPSFLLFPC